MYVENKLILYKYKSFAFIKNFEYAIDSLKNKYLYFSRPSELNDPFDCQIQIDFEANESEFESWKERNLDRIPQNNRLLTFEGKNQTLSEPRTQSGLELVRERLVEKNHLLSLTTDCLNESMWALYAGNYNGICIGYKIEDSNASFIPTKIEFKSEYGSLIVPTDIKEICFEQIKYDNDGSHPLKIFNKEPPNVDAIFYNLTHKKKCWNSEKEYRAIIHDTDYDITSIENKDVKVFYEDNMLGEVIFGYQVPTATRNTIIQMIKENYNSNIRFYLIDADLKNYTLVKKEI